jgi:hypothetical protein
VSRLSSAAWTATLPVLLGACAPPMPAPTSTDLGPLSKPPVVSARDGGAAVLVGDRMLWTFGDTLMTVTGADGFNYRSATAAWAQPGELAVEEALDSTGAPLQLFPYADDEASYNRANGPTERYAMWPGSAIAAPDGSGAWIFYQRLLVHPDALDFQVLDVGLARLAPGSTVAARDPAPLFAAPTPAYALGAVIDGGFVYLYACDPIAGEVDSECRVVRAAVGDAPSAAAWQAWNGAGWDADLTRAVPVLHGPPGDLSVSYNPYLGAFLAVYSGIFSNDVWCRSSPRPEGPWSAPQKMFVARAPASGNDYSGKEHPELASNGGRTVVVSYARGTGSFQGEVRLASITLP